MARAASSMAASGMSRVVRPGGEPSTGRWYPERAAGSRARLLRVRIRASSTRISCAHEPVPRHPQETHMSRKLFVGNLPYETMEQDLETLFGQAGAVETVTVMRDRVTGRARGFAFIEMASDDDAQKAITQFNGHQLGGRALTVNEARPQASRPGGGGGGGFGGGGGGGRGGNRSGGGRPGRRTDPRW